MDEIPEFQPSLEVPPDPPLPPPVRPIDLLRDAILDLFVVVLAGGAVVLAAGLALMALRKDPAVVLSSGWGIAILFLGTQLPLLYRGLRRRRRNREKQRPELPLFEATSMKDIVRGAGTGAALAIFSGLYTSAVSWALGPDSIENQVDFLRDMSDSNAAIALLVLIVAILAPFCEEIFFRGAIFATGRAVGLENAGVLISAVLFATMHLIPLLFPFYVLFGVVMCKLYSRSGTLAAPIADLFQFVARPCSETQTPRQLEPVMNPDSVTLLDNARTNKDTITQVMADGKGQVS